MLLKVRNGANTYRVIVDQVDSVRLECVTFVKREDLGDGIFCDELGQKIWMAMYHVRTYDTV